MSKSLKQFMAERRIQKKSDTSMDDVLLKDPYENAYSSKDTKRKATGFIYYPNLEHRNIWQEDYPENPCRATEIFERLNELNLISRCSEVAVQNLSNELENIIESVHGKKMLNKLTKLCAKPCKSEAEHSYDCVYYNGPQTILNAKQAALCCVSLTKQVVSSEIQNGFAVIRPPGHHSFEDPNGYCVFNNVALCAEYLLTSKLANKVLIVDYDVHHGQGTQRAFYERNDVLYFSIHRYEHGTFWPNLKESHSSYVGDKNGLGYTVNVPINETQCGDTEYLSIIFNILLPLAYEYNPDIILISAGYDACIGCPEGEMNVTPAFYGHLISLLSGLASGKIVCLLEGGYFTKSLAEGVAMTIKSLLNDTMAPLNVNKCVRQCVVDAINDTKFYLRKYWRCFQIEEISRNIPFKDNFDSSNEHIVVRKYYGNVQSPPYLFDIFFKVPKNKDELLRNKIKYLQSVYHKNDNLNNVCFIYDDRLLLHDSIGETVAQEKPKRLKEIIRKLDEFNLKNRMHCVNIKNNINPDEYIEKIHDKTFLNNINTLKNIPDRNDLYMNEHTVECVNLAVHNTISIADEMQTNNINYGFAFVRPPGHHACYNSNSGFCFLNNAVITANFLIEHHNLSKILIIDFDVHHGDGTQDLTYDRSDIMYVSVHRYDNGMFFPSKKSGGVRYIGKMKGYGYNINIPFSNEKMSNAEYISVWQRIVLPLAYSYGPQFIIVSAGFDAGINDSLGGYEVSPETFGHLIQMVKSISKTLVILEGGYNTETVSLAMVICVKALLGDPLPMPEIGNINESCKSTIRDVVRIHKINWPILGVFKKILDREYSEEEVHDLMVSGTS